MISSEFCETIKSTFFTEHIKLEDSDFMKVGQYRSQIKKQPPEVFYKKRKIPVPEHLRTTASANIGRHESVFVGILGALFFMYF